ncbi:MAG: D-glycero-beta-D-manno-heptose 1-phosphate adenylyltransferase [Candidatus Cloacimonadaceae bacterium]|jgi:D-beta-D-heptose 7-phosphate kinase/D-beta-D-heptose 1-phosphate adenosyltransferase|nr:D-glycero-beta-D-manno-heptose 1-phosphate adenylyltransferase [Candidatus Cloacimonadota bacterium]MDY0127562.1 D-glycero-beta-D-manno-heptose 1-phosphate adenylyltransferase [Candidatus Cloacimonadaceae bacterium]MCB5254595.1 D-glycero-beta-D-manno-heptose 1-phosphate adenylyltransferase [Candidatus Cloacimonadota bacterium]MCK9178246.1 D-glycero-beta-D-manno-heptose 1-phosphate adenylyltransferase [Candidatus Cloacimonadota bacterium]MCK9242528.1 D-glycero-beta-D-manno-heptose 1-phosphate
MKLTDKIIARAESSELGKKLHESGGKIVFTNGCFDIIHAGHVSYLSAAKALGDILILGLNSDKSVKKLKGKSRPINTQQDRATVLAAFSFVDYVIIFEEDTPYELIKELQPDILVKGGDWHRDQIVGSDLVLKRGGKVLSLSYVQGLSTTNILDKLKG